MKIWMSSRTTLGKPKKQKKEEEIGHFVCITVRNVQLTPKACARKLIFGDQGGDVDKIPAAILSHSESNILPRFCTIIVMFSAADVSEMF